MIFISHRQADEKKAVELARFFRYPKPICFVFHFAPTRALSGKVKVEI